MDNNCYGAIVESTTYAAEQTDEKKQFWEDTNSGIRLGIRCSSGSGSIAYYIAKPIPPNPKRRRTVTATRLPLEKAKRTVGTPHQIVSICSKNLPEGMREATPVVIAAVGDQAAEDFWTFFAAGIRNTHTRAAYLHACRRFFDWCAASSLTFHRIKPMHVAFYIELLTENHAATTVKQHLAAVRLLFDHLVVRQHLPYNPAASTRGPKVSARGDGKTPVFTAAQMEALFRSIPKQNVLDLRDRALLAVLLFSWVRISAALGMRVKDYTGAYFRVMEKGGLFREIQVHSAVKPPLEAYLEAAELTEDPDGPLFRSRRGRRGKVTTLTERALTRDSAFKMVKRRCEAAGLRGDYGLHSFRATAITEFMANGGALETAQKIAGHADSRTTGVYDRSNRRVPQNELERVHILVE